MYAILDNQGNICGQYGSPQPDNTPNYAEIDDSDSRVLIYRDSQKSTLAIQAKAALDSSDTTVIRCSSAGVVVPTDIHAYRVALRNIWTAKDTTSTQLPVKPSDYPEGT